MIRVFASLLLLAQAPADGPAVTGPPGRYAVDTPGATRVTYGPTWVVIAWGDVLPPPAPVPTPGPTPVPPPTPEPPPAPAPAYKPMVGPLAAALILPDPPGAAAALKTDPAIAAAAQAAGVAKYRTYLRTEAEVQGTTLKSAADAQPGAVLVIWPLQPLGSGRAFPVKDASEVAAALIRARSGAK